MSEHALPKAPLHARALDEFKVMAALALYLYICLGAVILFKSAVLSSAGIDFTIWGIAAVKAVLLAKFMLVGKMLHIGNRYRDKPLIVPTLYHALMYLIVLLILTTVEELVVGVIHQRAIIDSLQHVVGPTFFQGIAASLIMFLILVPFSAFTCLSDALGEREIFRLFFIDRSVDGQVQERLAGRSPPSPMRG
jgi:hypothetical protein